MGETRIFDIVPQPPAPRSLEEAGLSLDLVVQLALKTLHFVGELTGAELASRLGLRYSVIEPAMLMLKTHQHVDVSGGSMLGGPSYRFRITDAGRTRAQLFLESSHYVGAAPVPLAHYHRYMASFKAHAPKTAFRSRVQDVFAHLVVSQRVLDQLGPAINAGHSMFVYGPPGNGKTVISKAIQKLLDGDIHVPHALEIEGAIIRLYDPVMHEQVALPAESARLTGGDDVDRRWIRCRRPLVMVGGELTMDALELSHNATSGFYKAPVQAIANGGMLVIDDFGRQRMKPRELLNRWIVPLETGVDFLTLNTGQKFDLPFQVLVVFATNIRPLELVDEAFLRRIQYKVFCESPTRDEFVRIFGNYCAGRGVPFDARLVEDLLTNYYEPRGIPLRGCQPRDLIEHALSLAEYAGEPLELTRPLLRSACDSYFVDDSAAASSSPAYHA
jgi:hypothetical protein